MLRLFWSQDLTQLCLFPNRGLKHQSLHCAFNHANTLTSTHLFPLSYLCVYKYFININQCFLLTGYCANPRDIKNVPCPLGPSDPMIMAFTKQWSYLDQCRSIRNGSSPFFLFSFIAHKLGEIGQVNVHCEASVCPLCVNKIITPLFPHLKIVGRSKWNN